MRHPHGLRASAGANAGIPIGSAYQGGFFAGYISHTDNGIATHGLIVAPAASGYNGQVTLVWLTSTSSAPGTDSSFDGVANSAAMTTGQFAAGNYCNQLTISGYSDWYLPARYELDIAYENLKPTTTSNSASWGINPYSVPERTVNRTAGAPAQTSVAAFQSGGAEAFVAGTHWSSTQFSSANAWRLSFSDGAQGDTRKDTSFLVRAFRRFAL
jgi:hypothetical protein